jgi:opacity protein-like surface antigen
MIKFALFLVSLIGLTTSIFGQENDKSKLGYGMSLGFGNSTLENNQLGILNGNLFALRFNLDYTFTEKENTRIIFGIEVLEFNSNFYNGENQSKLKNEYLQIPLKFTHLLGLDKDKRFNLVTGIGAYANYLLRSGITSLSDKINTNSGGINFGYNIILGMEYYLSPGTSIRLNCDLMNELSTIKRSGYEQKQSEIILFNIGISTKF